MFVAGDFGDLRLILRRHITTTLEIVADVTLS
jgi:hypothetical protein